MYASSDPRSRLAADADNTAAGRPVAPAQYYDFADETAAVDEGDARVWYARAQNFVALYAKARPGAVLVRADQPDEYVLLLPDPGCGAVVEWNGARHEIEGLSIVFVPAGDSTVALPQGGTAIRLFTTRAADLVARCAELCPEFEADGNVPALAPWPEPPEGPAVRAYPLDVAPEEGRFGRIFRCTTFMVNYLYPRSGPRDRSQLSPHKHDRFQQASLCLEGRYVHHIRWPWDTDAATWRDDHHTVCGAPSLAVIPARALHTSEAVGAGTNMLVDIFCPPRADFSNQPGWVLNADDYPAPDTE
ncbi:hypothetical protein P1J78_13390 [Psychromarinibacter sp. C21-152]|uniref:Uncharacterized protein n=1 Tax=Psychromarinibacter sediminicola TaxID=3033385 RepID=A0AAE3T9D2_9RHOB|nr:hypothetical protein [Psychromarinibacter sediminicola]MDF0601733.1 hypothetical protein [Psychromarinibacter sediminicola]